VINAGIDIAIEAAKEEAYVFADMGSLSADSNHAAFEEYKILADIFLEKGINHFLFETRNSTVGLKAIGEYIKERSPESFIIASFLIGIRQFLLLPNSTITVSSVISIKTP